jgi:hypothetical protein
VEQAEIVAASVEAESRGARPTSLGVLVSSLG